MVVIREGLAGFVQGYGFISDLEAKGLKWISFSLFVKTTRKEEASSLSVWSELG